MLAIASAFLPVLVAAMLLAQTPPTGEPEPVIPPIVWELVAMTASNDGPLTIDEPGRYTMQFQRDNRVVVRGDCNQLAGVFTAGDRDLEVSLSLATLEPCPAGSHSAPFLRLLASATAFETGSDGFLMISGEQGQLRLRPTLAGVVWEWQEFRGGNDSLITPSHPADYSLTFLPDGTLAIVAGCVRTTGTFRVDGPILAVSFDDAPRPQCRPEPLAERYLRDLAEVSSHVFRDGNLYLSLRTDAGIMAFAARYVEPPRGTPRAEPPATEPA